jgi:hypothetical protein
MGIEICIISGYAPTGSCFNFTIIPFHVLSRLLEMPTEIKRVTVRLYAPFQTLPDDV